MERLTKLMALFFQYTIQKDVYRGLAQESPSNVTAQEEKRKIERNINQIVSDFYKEFFKCGKDE